MVILYLILLQQARHPLPPFNLQIGAGARVPVGAQAQKSMVKADII
jgi:hypothetical protein